MVATNPFALVFLLPSLHVWLWLPQVRGAPIGVRLGVLALGFAGPALLLGSFALRFGLGWDAPLVSRGAQGGRLRPLRRHAAPGRLAGGHRAARRSRHASLRAVSGGGRTAAPRPASEGRAHHHARAARSATARTCRRARSVGGLDARASSSPGNASRRRGRADARLGTARLAMAGPVHRALHEVEAAPARLAVRQAGQSFDDHDLEARP